MPFNRPTLKDLVERVTGDIESRLPGADARLRRSNLNVLAKVLAGAAHGLYGFLNTISRQVIIDTADADSLERWANVWGVARTAATPAGGSVALTGTGSPTVPAGTELQRSDGVRYRVLADTRLIAGAATAAIEAVLPGAAGNTDAGSTLLMPTAIAGVASAAIVLEGGLSGGTDTETDTGLRERLLFRIQRPPQGGAASDYVAWAKAVPGVTRVWVRPQYTEANNVTVFFVRDNDAGDIIPSSGEVALVQAHLDGLRPVTADVVVVAPTPLPVAFEIELTPNSSAVREAVEAELRDLLQRESEPGGTILISHIREAVSIAAGEHDHVISEPLANVVADPGEMPILGEITWL